MNPRQFLAAVAALALVVAGAHAQTPARTGKLPRVGIFFTSPPQKLTGQEKIFVDAMRELGWVEGTTVLYDRAYTDKELSTPEEMQAHAAMLISRKPDVIWLLSTNNAKAVHAKTRTIPIVGATVADVVENNLASSLPRPGGNFTGLTNIGWELGGKRYEYLQEIMPNLTRVGVLVIPDDKNDKNKTNNTKRELQLIEAAASRRVAVIPVEMNDPKDEKEAIVHADNAFADLAKQQVQAVLITHLPMFQRYQKAILRAAEKRRIPAVGHRTVFAEDGALFAYSSVLEEQLRGSARIVDKILKGARASDTPVEQPTRFELVINLKTAKVLGVTVPDSVMAQAHRIIQ